MLDDDEEAVGIATVSLEKENPFLTNAINSSVYNDLHDL